MQAIFELYESFDDNNNLVLQETLIDSIFKYLDQNDFNSVISPDGLFNLKKEFEGLTHVKIEFHNHTDSSIKIVHGQYERPNIIHIYIPKKKEDLLNLTDKDIISVFLHEFSHLITDKNIPQVVYIKNEPRDTKLIPPPVENVNFVDSEEKIEKFLDYVFQIREMPNFALSFSFELVEYKRTLNVDSIFDQNKKHFQLNSDDIRYYLNLPENLKLLFQVQYFTNKVKKFNYLRKLMKLKKLIEKYRRRLLEYLK